MTHKFSSYDHSGPSETVIAAFGGLCFAAGLTWDSLCESVVSARDYKGSLQVVWLWTPSEDHKELLLTSWRRIAGQNDIEHKIHPDAFPPDRFSEEEVEGEVKVSDILGGRGDSAW